MKGEDPVVLPKWQKQDQDCPCVGVRGILDDACRSSQAAFITNVFDGYEGVGEVPGGFRRPLEAVLFCDCAALSCVL